MQKTLYFSFFTTFAIYFNINIRELEKLVHQHPLTVIYYYVKNSCVLTLIALKIGICLSKQCVRFLYLINFYIKQLIFFHKSSIITIFISFDCLLLIYSTIFITYSTVCFTKIIYRTLGLLRFNKINKIL